MICKVLGTINDFLYDDHPEVFDIPVLGTVLNAFAYAIWHLFYCEFTTQ